MNQIHWSHDMRGTPAQVMSWIHQCAGQSARVSALGAAVPLPGGAAVIEWQKKPPRLVGMDTLPVTRVSISFKGVDAGDRAHFIQQFEDAAKQNAA